MSGPTGEGPLPGDPFGLTAEQRAQADVDWDNITWMAIACRPRLIDGLPQVPGVDLTDIVTIEHSLDACEMCDREVWIGPRQLEHWRRNQNTQQRAVKVCYWCMFTAIRAHDQSPDDTPVISLGGGEAPSRGV